MKKAILSIYSLLLFAANVHAQKVGDYLLPSGNNNYVELYGGMGKKDGNGNHIIDGSFILKRGYPIKTGSRPIEIGIDTYKGKELSSKTIRYHISGDTVYMLQRIIRNPYGVDTINTGDKNAWIVMPKNKKDTPNWTCTDGAVKYICSSEFVVIHLNGNKLPALRVRRKATEDESDDTYQYYVKGYGYYKVEGVVDGQTGHILHSCTYNEEVKAWKY